MDLTHGGFVGTPNFASPEQFGSSSVDVRSDIYSLGATLWFALTGKTPFAGRSIEELRNAQRSNALPIEQLKIARVPSGLRSLLKSMLAIEPASRPNVQELAAKLRLCATHASGLRGAQVIMASAAILILAVSAFVIFRSLHVHPALAGAASEAPEKSIAVLPFENPSNDPNAEYLSEGISEALINSLTDLQRLRVIARSTAFQYKDKDVDPRQVGRELHVATVLTGRVRQDAGRSEHSGRFGGRGHRRAALGRRISPQNFRSDCGQTGNRTRGHREVEVEIVRRRAAPTCQNDSTNTEAYQFYLRGRYFWNKRTPDGIKQAIDEFQQSDRARSEFRSWLCRVGGLLYWVDVLQFCRAARSNAKGKRIGNKGAGTG